MRLLKRKKKERGFKVDFGGILNGFFSPFPGSYTDNIFYR